jgi:hypothetical protein
MIDVDIDAKDLDRFESLIAKDETTGCWIWNGSYNRSKTRFGYIHGTTHKREFISARQLSFILYIGRIPTKYLAVSCNNFQCISPDHIHEGSIKYNTLTIDHVSRECHCTGKKCPVCNKVLCIGRFSISKTNIGGRRFYCHECENIYLRTSRYGLSLPEYHNLLNQHKGYCSICGSSTDDLNIDHNHQTNHTRGLLCKSCNSRMKGIDDPEWLTKAVEYMDRFGDTSFRDWLEKNHQFTHQEEHTS